MNDTHIPGERVPTITNMPDFLLGILVGIVCGAGLDELLRYLCELLGA